MNVSKFTGGLGVSGDGKLILSVAVATCLVSISCGSDYFSGELETTREDIQEEFISNFIERMPNIYFVTKIVRHETPKGCAIHIGGNPLPMGINRILLFSNEGTSSYSITGYKQTE